MSNLDKYNAARRRDWTSRCGLTFPCRRCLKEHQKNCIDCKRLIKTNNQFTKAKELGLEAPKPWNKGKCCPQLSRQHTEKEKEKISASMKKAHAEGRAHNIGECRWNNEPSYPEQWFMKVLKNEFGLEKDKDYKMEFTFHKFSLDFAWPNEKICIEIDGEQHERFQEQKNRDVEKDKLLKEEGWVELRKSWKEIFNSPKEFIKEVEIILGRC